MIDIVGLYLYTYIIYYIWEHITNDDIGWFQMCGSMVVFHRNWMIPNDSRLTKGLYINHLLRGLGGHIPMNTYAYLYTYIYKYHIYIYNIILYQHISTAPATFEKGLGRRWYLPHWWVRQDVSWRDRCEGWTETMTDMHPTQMNQGYYKYRQIPVQVPHHLIIRQFPWLTCSIVE